MAEPYVPREITPALLHALEEMPAVVLTGMRQTGKTTLLRRESALAGRRYVTLDDFGQLEAARREPEGLLGGDAPVTIDEVQKQPGLLVAVKRRIDEARTAGRYLLSGSANLALLRDVSESLAGRAVYLTLHPFTRRELRRATRERPFLLDLFEAAAGQRAERLVLARGRAGIEPILPEEVLQGGMPPVTAGPHRDRRLWFDGYEQTYLERDLRSLAQVGDLVAFRRLLRLAALRTGQVLNQSQLARDCSLNAVTTRRWLDLLATSFLVCTVPAFLSSRTRRLRKSPKLFLADSGLAAHLAGVTELDPASGEPMRGALFETYVAQNVQALLAAHWPGARLHFWQVHGQYEVDLVVESGRDCLAIEVKAGTRWESRDLAGLEAFLEAAPRCRAAILAHNGKDAVSLGRRLWAIPLGLLLA